MAEKCRVSVKQTDDGVVVECSESGGVTYPGCWLDDVDGEGLKDDFRKSCAACPRNPLNMQEDE